MTEMMIHCNVHRGDRPAVMAVVIEEGDENKPMPQATLQCNDCLRSLESLGKAYKVIRIGEPNLLKPKDNKNEEWQSRVDLE